MGNKNKKGRSLFFMGKWKQGIALFLSVILSITSVLPGIVRLEFTQKKR